MTRHSSLLAGAAGAAVISTSAVLIKLSELPATTVAALRTGYALPVLALLGLAVRYRRGPRGPRHRGFSLLAGLLFAGCVLLQNWSIELIGAGVATVVCNLQVLVVAVGGWWLFAEKPPRRLLLALPAALLGVVMVSGIVGGQEFGSDAGLGVLAGLANSLCYGAFLLVLRHAQSRGDGNTVVMLRDVVAVACAVCLSAVAAGGFAHGGLSPSALGLLPSWPAHGWMLLLALGPQVLGWLMITSALPRLPVAVSGLLLLLQPMIAMTLSMILLGEKPSTVQLTGCALLMLAIAGGVLGGRSPRPEPSITEPDETGAASPAAVEPATRTAPPAVTGAT